MASLLSKHGTFFDCGGVPSDAKNYTHPGQFYFGGTAPKEHHGKHCSQCRFYQLEQKKGSKPKDEGNALKKGAHRTNKGLCTKHREAMKKPVMFEGDKAMVCKYFEPQSGGN